jgi:hypothetical protein
MAKVGKTRCRNEADIASANHCDVHARSRSLLLSKGSMEADL